MAIKDQKSAFTTWSQLFVMAVVLSLTLPIEAYAMSQKTKPALPLSCSGPNSAQICPIFQSALETRFPKQHFVASGQNTPALVELKILHSTPHSLTVQLTSESPEKGRISGPERSYDVMDRPFNDELYLQVLTQLLQEEAVAF